MGVLNNIGHFGQFVGSGCSAEFGSSGGVLFGDRLARIVRQIGEM